MGKTNGLEGRRDVDDILSTISSDKVDSRTKGLRDLVAIIKEEGSRPRKQQISDIGYHTILENLFRGTKYEIAYHARANKVSGSRSESRLTTCASLVRSIVESQVRKIGAKTVKAIVEHVCQSLPSADGSYCGPLVFDYVRTLLSLVEYKPHVENFSSEEVHDTITFCLDLARDLSRIANDQKTPTSSGEPLSLSDRRSNLTRVVRSATPSLVNSHGGSFSKDIYQRMAHPQLQSSAGGILFCLQHLTSVPTGPVLERAEEILALLFDLLQSNSNVSTIQQPAFEAINYLMPRILTSNVQLACKSMMQFVKLLRFFWQVRANGLKEVLLSIFLYGECLLPLLVFRNEANNFDADLAAVVEILRQEYCERRHKDLLTIEDVELSDYTQTSSLQAPLGNRVTCIRRGAIKAEEPYSLLRISAAIIVALDEDTSMVKGGEEDNADGRRSKRQRLTKHMDEVVGYIRSVRFELKVYGLQVLTFIFESRQFSTTDLLEFLDVLAPTLSDEDGNLASWTMLAMTSASKQATAGDHRMKEIWLRSWRIVFRQITFSSTCRAACHLSAKLLDTGLVQYSEVRDLIDGMLTSTDLNSPAECDAAATQLWHVILTLRGQENLHSVTALGGPILSWLFKRWSPANLTDRQLNMYKAQQMTIRGTLRLLCTCLGIRFGPSEVCLDPDLGRLFQTRFEVLQHQDLIEYLAFPGSVPQANQATHQTFKSVASEIPPKGNATSMLASTALDFLINDCSHLNREYFTDPTNSTSLTSSDMVRVIGCLCVIGYAILSDDSISNQEKGGILRKALGKLKTGLKDCLLQHERRRDLLDGLIDVFGELPNPMGQEKFASHPLLEGYLSMSCEFDSKFWHSVSSTTKSSNGMEEQDSLDLEIGFEAQAKQERNRDTTSELIHNHITAAMSPESLRFSMIARICFMSLFRQDFRGGEMAERSASSAFVDYLTALKRQEFLLCRPVLREFLRSGIPITEDDADTLLQYLSQTFTQRYETQRSEVALGVCLEVMTDLAAMWTGPETECAGAGAELYIWLLTNIMDGDPASAHVQICAASLFQTIIKVSPDYAKSLSLASARTSLFKVLSTGSPMVKFRIGKDISALFGLFVLKEHEHILEDVIETLPSDPAWTEGIALRLFVLAHLAASWSTLLRRCVYAIFETPGHVSSSTGHAKYCLRYVSISLGLADSQELFKLFAPQIIYTWLETEPLRSIPYSVFGYGSFKTMLEDVQDEVVGQIMMRGKEIEAVQIAEDLEVSFEVLLEGCFAKASAYSIARDIAVPPTANSRALGAEGRLRKGMGKEKYACLVTTNFAEIIAIFHITMDFEEQIEKSFQKRPGYSTADTAYREMKGNSASSKVLPPSQQPSFKAKYLIDEIEFLCRRTSYDPDSIWTPTLYVHVFRRLLGMIQPAFGSLHTCSVLRKIRILVSIAGATALTQYPLEMALHALKPLLTEAQCAEDTIGIFQYLVAHGWTYLAEVPSFLAGTAVTTLISMRAFLDSTQDSTTQESQFQVTITRARALHAWFAAYLKKYKSSHLTEEALASFLQIIESASNVNNRGNARTGTYESELMLLIFEDQRSGRELLSSSTRGSILRKLCASFENPPEYRQDVLGNVEMAALYAPIVLENCQQGRNNSNYMLWCSRVLGRAYAGQGHIKTKVKAEAISTPRAQVVKEQMSHTRILKTTCAFLQSDVPEEVGVAETALRGMITAARGTEIFQDCDQVLSSSLMKAMFWSDYHLPGTSTDSVGPDSSNLESIGTFREGLTAGIWIQELTVALCNIASDDPLLSGLPEMIRRIKIVSGEIFPYVLHLVLLKEVDGQRTTRAVISRAIQSWFLVCLSTGQEQFSVRILLKAILYLHQQPLPHETVKADRSQWLEIDYRQAATVAARCSMYETSLMFFETDRSEQMKTEGIASKRDSRRQARVAARDASDLLLDIYKHVDEQDAFYGVKQPSSLDSMMNQLEYEHAGFKSLSFRGAHYDGQVRLGSGNYESSAESMACTLDSLDLNGLSQSMLSKMSNTGALSIDAALQTARKLEKWEISAPSTHLSPSSTTFRVFQNLNISSDVSKIQNALQSGFSDLMNQLIIGESTKSATQATLAHLAILTEIDEIFSCRGLEQLKDVMIRLEARHVWMRNESFDHVNTIMSCRETSFSSLSKRAALQNMVKTSLRDARTFEARVLLASSCMSRSHNALQNALTTATYLSQVVKPCQHAGVNIDAAVRFESANVLWDQNEMTTSIRMLQDLEGIPNTESDIMRPGKAELLAKLGHQISEARLEKPDEIIKTYLAPAIKALGNTVESIEASEVFHEFAFFCDQQLQNADGLEDFQRIKELRERKVAEVQDLEDMMMKAPSQGKERDNLRNHRNKAKLWLDLDDQEYQRLRGSRQTFLKQSLENYLLCLKASDKHDSDALRFSALWLENHDSELANAAVAKHINQVGSRKFAPLMNQWSSRLLQNSSQFQILLFQLVLRICVEHPYHGMYQVFASSKSKGGKDETAMARYAAANAIVEKLKVHKRASRTWISLHNTNVNFVRFAGERLEDVKPGAKVSLRKSLIGQRIEQEVDKYQVPPPTMTIALRPSCDYSDVTSIARFQPEFTLAGGISAPKIITALGTDGVKYKQLFKGGNDDLRQDAIMEQVFSAVSALLATQRSTRQRALKIRTYKVLPLTATAGIIEFVQNTVPLHDYLLPAHQRHYSRDLKPNVCRKHIADVQSSSVDVRIKTFRKVTQQFHPVLRYFFFERFESPDDWFATRLAYTRSTAAISILGHVLGLGDRHGHNILLDETTGEVVHIDLGIAFEQGRVLPVPEVVPFRLTRDLVDAMGCTETEGVFRRCCEFTLDALRNESYSIMTILDVLRYDPLYSWSLSPLRVKRMQEQGDEGGGIVKREGEFEDGEGRKGDGEPGEADRALTVVKKKLSKSLSVQATVNELISAATDERNLAVLFCGWAAYA